MVRSWFTVHDDGIWIFVVAAEDWYLFTVVSDLNHYTFIVNEYCLVKQRNVITLPFNSPDPDWSRSREAEVDCPER